MRHDTGQATAEYVAILAIVALLLAGGFAVAAPPLGAKVVEAVRTGLCLVGGDICRPADAAAAGPDGSFPQNSRVDGTPVWGGLQLDEVALPIVLAYQLRPHRRRTWAGVKRAADFLLGFQQDGNRAPWTPQERWENQSGYSPATIASRDRRAGLRRRTSPAPTATRRPRGATWPPPTTGRPGSRAGRSRRPGRTPPGRTSCG